MKGIFRRQRLLGGVIGVALLVGCRGAPQAERVSVAVLPYLSYAPLFIAADEGLFAAQGLDVDLVEVGTTEATAALARGEVDAVSNYLTTGVFNTILRGGRLRLVADKGYESADACLANALVVHSALVGGSQPFDLESLAGRRLDLRAGQMEEYWVEALLGRHGLTLGDVEIRVVPHAAKLEAIRSGAVDAAPWSEPYLTQVVAAGAGVAVARPSDVLPNMQWAFLMYGRSLLDERPEVGERLMVAYLQGVRRYLHGDRRRNAAVIAAHTGLPVELIERACWMPVREDGVIDTASVTRFQRWAVAKGYQDGVVPPEQFWDPRFAARAAATLAAEREGRE